MKHEAKKIAKIVDEMLTYFLYNYNARSEILVDPAPGEYRITVTCTGVDMSDEAFAALSQRLVVARQPELEDYYWQLTGETDESSEMSLVGMMCDSIDVTRDGSTITLRMVRKV